MSPQVNHEKSVVATQYTSVDLHGWVVDGVDEEEVEKRCLSIDGLFSDKDLAEHLLQGFKAVHSVELFGWKGLHNYVVVRGVKECV